MNSVPLSPSNLLTQAISSTLADNSAVVASWLAGEPGSWGRLAGAGVIAYRNLLGRTLTDTERRQVWAALWQALQLRKQSG